MRGSHLVCLVLFSWCLTVLSELIANNLKKSGDFYVKILDFSLFLKTANLTMLELIVTYSNCMMNLSVSVLFLQCWYSLHHLASRGMPPTFTRLASPHGYFILTLDLG